MSWVFYRQYERTNNLNFQLKNYKLEILYQLRDLRYTIHII